MKSQSNLNYKVYFHCRAVKNSSDRLDIRYMGKNKINLGRISHLRVSAILIFLFVVFCISPSIFAGQRLSITSKIANIRSGPGSNYDVMWQVEKYFPIIIIGRKGNWYHFKDFEGDTGWVHKSLVGNAKTVISIKRKCNVRVGPDPKQKIAFTIEKGVPLKVLGKKGNWLKVEYMDGDRGWIYKTLVW